MKLYNKLKNKLGVIALVALLFQITMPVYQGYVYATGNNDETIEVMEDTEETDEEINSEDSETKTVEDTSGDDTGDSQEEDDNEDGSDVISAENQNERDDNLSKEIDSNPDQIETKENEEILADIDDMQVGSNREPISIEENIIDDFKLLKKDGTEFEDDEFIEVDDDLRFELDWSLPNDHEYVAGDTFKFQLPKQLIIHNKIDDGKLGNYGSFEVDLDGNVTFIFNEKIEEESNIKGTFFIDTELKEELIKSTNENLEIIFNDDVAKKITINVKPTSGQAIHKEGQPVDGNFNTEKVNWTVLVNTRRDSLKNAIVNDPILDGMELDLDSIELEEVEVDLAGDVVENLGKIEGFTNNSTKEELNIALGDTNKAYQLTFTTIMTEEEKDNEGTKKYNNTVYLNSDDQTKKESGASVSVDRPKSMEKTSSNFNKGDRSVEWTVNANFNEKKLNAGDEITDEFNFTVGNENFNDIFDIVKEDITIEQVDQFDNDGEPSEKSDATGLFEIKIDGNKVTYKLKEDTDKAFVLNYKTEAKDGKIINKNGTIVNSVNLNGNTDTSSQGIVQQVGTKTNAGIDYENKTIDWTITINADKQDLRNFILKDDFAGSGQKLVENSIEISPTNDTASISPNGDLEGFEIDFGDITDSYKITYQTEFTYNFDEGKTPNFKNGVNITYKTSDGNDYELEIGDQVNPNKQTKSNGAKNGKANNDTKEMTWTVDINYNQLDLTGAEVVDEIADNQSLIEGSMKVYETTIGSGGKVNVGDEVTENFSTTAEENLIKVDFGDIDQSYRVEFVTKDKDDLYNSDEKYTNTAQFKPGDGKTHDLKANVTLPNQGEFLGKKGLHNKEDWTIDWEIDVNKSKSSITDVTVDDDLGSTDAQILLKDSIKVTKKGSSDGLVEGEDYNLTIDGNKLSVNIPGEITDHYVVKYSSYIVVEEEIDIKNEAEITSVDEMIVGSTEKTETVSVKFSTGGGSGEGETAGLTINKSELVSNRALEGIEFELVKTIGSEEIVVREGKTDAEGKLAWKGLKFGDYTLKEVIPDGYLGKETQSVTVSSNEDNNINLLPIENERKTGTAKIIKVDSVTGDTLEGAEFELTNQTTGMDYKFITKADGVVEEEIPFGEYTIEEITAPEGYRITKDIDDITVEIDKTTEIELENVAFVEVEGQKTWYADEDTELPESITVKLFADGKEIKKKDVTSSDNWEYSFKNLDKYNGENNEIDYEIKEVGNNDYIVNVTEEDTNEDYKYKYNLTNIESTSVSGRKTWQDDDNATEKQPSSITVELIGTIEKDAEIKEVITKSTEVNKETAWKYDFANLPKYTPKGEKITYEVKESVDGYDTSFTKTEEGFDIVNTRAEDFSIKGEKIWNDISSPRRPDNISIELSRQLKKESNLEDAEVELVKTIVVESDKEGKWSYDFGQQPRFNEIGEEYVYSVKEKEVPAGYRSSYEIDDDGNYNIINTRVGSTSVSGTKTWKDDDPADRPEMIKVNLLRNNSVIRTQEVTAEDDWKYSFTGLSRYDSNGRTISYSVKEQAVPGYASTINGREIINTRSEKTSIEITKGWLDDNSTDRPDSVTVDIYQNDELFETVKVKAADDWIYELADIEAYDEDGEAYIYRLEEEPVEGYETKIDGYNITNILTDKTTVTGEKTWKDSGSRKRPASIEVKLIREVNGEADENFSKVQTVKAGLLGKWTYTFDELEKYDENGVAYTYRVEENKVVEGYESIVDGYNITNLRVGTTAINVEKIWEDDREQDRPQTIQIELLQNGQVIEEVTLSKANNWTHQFTDLEEFDEEGKAYVYTVNEQEVDNYTSSIERDNNTFKITNTYDDEGKVEGEGPDDRPGDKPGSGSGDGPSGGTAGESPQDKEDSTRPGDEDRLPQTGEANNTLLYVIGTLFILVGLGIGRKKFEQ